MNKSTTHFLLSRFIDTEYDSKWLSEVSAERLQQLHKNLTDIFIDMELEITIDDTKEAWKCWFDWSAYNGLLISPDFSIVDPEVPYKHAELEVIDKLIELACTAIDKL